MEKLLLIWSDKYAVNNTAIDEQHKKLFAIINDLYTSFFLPTVPKDLKQVLKELYDYTDYHFSEEEKYFLRFDYPDKALHIKQHKNFLSKILEFRRNYEDGTAEITNDLFTYLQTWLSNHVLNIDIAFFKPVGQA